MSGSWGPPVSPPFGPASPGPGGRQSPFWRASWFLPVVILLGLGLVVGVVVAFVGNGSSTNTSSGEIFLQPASDPGRNPFGPSVASPLSPSASPAGQSSSTTGSSTAVHSTSGPRVVTATSGGTPELYGGSKRLSICDKSSMIAFLEANPAKAAAWAAVQGIPVSNLSGYIERLTPVVLRTDTRVTNHGYAAGRATPFQAVLQAGTAVLVDEYGVPRARCACGNPLLPPVPVTTTPQYPGTPWPGFNPGNVTVITKSTTVINVIIVIDIETGQPIGIPVNPAGQPSGSSSASSGASSSSSSSPSPPTSASSSPPTAGSGWRLTTAKYVPLQGQPDYTISRSWTATGGGITLTLHDNGYLCGGAGGTETVTYSWSFARDVTDLANGDTFGATVNAAKVSTSGTCTGGLAARSGAAVTGIGGGSLPLTAFDRPPDTARVFGGSDSATADASQGGKQTTTATLSVISAPSDPTHPDAGFQVIVQGPGVEFFILYVYEQA